MVKLKLSSPSSNFHLAKITNDHGTVSDNVENRAEFLDDVGAVAAIKTAITAFACYQSRLQNQSNT